MKIALAMFSFAVLFLSAGTSHGQKVTTTRELADIAAIYGVDSALNMASSANYLYKIDLPVAEYIASKCTTANTDARQYEYITEMGLHVKTKLLNTSALEMLHGCRSALYKTNRYTVIRAEIADRLCHMLVFQHNASSLPYLQNEFTFWATTADSIKKRYHPSIAKRLQNGITTPLDVLLYQTCTENSYKIAWTLRQLGDNAFTEDRIHALRNQLNSKRYAGSYIENVKTKQQIPETVALSGNYTSVTEIDFNNEPDIFKDCKSLKDIKIRKKFITNGNTALCEIVLGKPYTAGKVFVIQLTDHKTISLTMLDEWKFCFFAGPVL